MALTFKSKQQRKLPIFKLLALAVIGLILLLGSNAFANAFKDTIGYRGLVAPQIGRYQVEHITNNPRAANLFNEGTTAWVLDTVTGQLRFCYVFPISDTPYPRCGHWSEDDRDEYKK